ncbi:hypothetical protein KO528_05995 [Saccharophagus degradans]|uniref:hypothetical protein n=1 Tax=Saccharophagus degradans TaxID=86304 RepID=UPI001C088A26|nr:hypothetical protein [Saccharophagus degradans]MBU2984891.1 hypothetical protein [Saccharophagus degradans]
MTLEPDNNAVISHLNWLQSIVARLATNSSSCKTWCITVVAATLALVANQSLDNSDVSLAIAPIILFFVLDTYYLSLEIQFRMHHEFFVEKLHSSKLLKQDLYVFSIDMYKYKARQKAICSWSVWGFYLMIVVAMFVATKLVSNVA